MKLIKTLIPIIVIALGMSLFTGCSSRKDNINGMDMSEVERLPEQQKDAELDKTLAEMRRYRTNSYKTENGGQIAMSMTDTTIPGQTKNRPDFTEDMDEIFYEFIYDYLKNELEIPERSYGYDVTQCIDPRVNAIYDDADKGVATGYENENILLMEYQTATDGVYSYLILVRDSSEGKWNIIYNGLSYKE